MNFNLMKLFEEHGYFLLGLASYDDQFGLAHPLNALIGFHEVLR